MNWNRLVSMLLLGVMLLSGAALAEDFAPALDTSTVCEITVAGNYKNFEALEMEFERFNDWYPDVALEFVTLDQYKSSIGMALAGAEAPDIYCAFNWMLDQMDTYQSLFDAAEDLKSTDVNLDCIREGLLYTAPDGSVPMVPVFSTTYGMLVNESIFEEQGLAIPTTYSELIAACEALKAAGYVSPVMGYSHPKDMYTSLALPFLYATVAGDSAAVEQLNAMGPGCGEYVRPVLEMVDDFMSRGFVDLEACESIEDNYASLILRFFEGDVPMMISDGDVVSGTKKRESLSEAYSAKPFTYSFHPIPVDEEGGYFLNTVNMNFAVNVHSENLEMVNEFMRFLVCTDELNEMASVKGLVTTSSDLSFDGMFAAFDGFDPARTIMDQHVGLVDRVLVQTRNAAWQIGIGAMTVDEAVAAFGTIQEQ